MDRGGGHREESHQLPEGIGKVHKGVAVELGLGDEEFTDVFVGETES